MVHDYDFLKGKYHHYFSSIREIDLKSPTVVEMRDKSTILFKVCLGARSSLL